MCISRIKVNLKKIGKIITIFSFITFVCIWRSHYFVWITNTRFIWSMKSNWWMIDIIDSWCDSKCGNKMNFNQIWLRRRGLHAIWNGWSVYFHPVFLLIEIICDLTRMEKLIMKFHIVKEFRNIYCIYGTVPTQIWKDLIWWVKAL